MSHEPSSSLFGEAASARQLIIRAERQRERQLASLFYETAGGAPGGRRRRGRGGTKSRGRRSKRAGTNAAAAGGQAFSGTRELARRKNQRLQARKKARNRESGGRQGLVGSNTMDLGSTRGNVRNPGSIVSLQHQHRLQQNMTPGGTPLMSQSLPVLTAAGSELSDA